MKKLENLYAGLGGRTFVGGIDLEWAATHKNRYLQIKNDAGETVCFIDLTILFQANKERKNKGKEVEKDIGEAKRISPVRDLV